MFTLNYYKSNNYISLTIIFIIGMSYSYKTYNVDYTCYNIWQIKTKVLKYVKNYILM